MKSSEIEAELGMTYKELVDYLLEKYGPSEYDYFVNESCRTKNKKIVRSSEGLICHHIDEDKAIMLSDPRFAVGSPFEYQKASRLVYCNILEHLILHIKIAGEANEETVGMGIGGAVVFICPELNDYYNGFDFKREYQRKAHELVADNFDDYIKVLRYFLDVAEKHIYLVLNVTPDKLSRGSDGQIVEKTYKALTAVV